MIGEIILELVGLVFKVALYAPFGILHPTLTERMRTFRRCALIALAAIPGFIALGFLADRINPEGILAVLFLFAGVPIAFLTAGVFGWLNDEEHTKAYAAKCAGPRRRSA